MTTMTMTITMQRYGRQFGTMCLLGGLAGSFACSSPDLSGPTSADPTQLYYTMTLSAHAITLDTLPPYDTLQLSATARNALGAPLPGVPTPTFTSSDSSVRVSATGLLTARAARNNVLVIATLVYQGIRLADTATVNVTASTTPPPTFDHLDFGLLAGDSATIALPNFVSRFYFPISKTLRTAAVDATGTQIPGSLVALGTSDVHQATVPEIVSATVTDVSIPASNVEVAQLGPVTVYASATVYGVALQDSVQLTITPPLLAVFQAVDQAVPGRSTPAVTLLQSFPQVIGRGGIIWWLNQTTDSLDIVFDDPTAASSEGGFLDAGGGDIPAFPGCPGFLENCFNVQGRKFLQAGTVHFHSVRTGVTGTIIVQ